MEGKDKMIVINVVSNKLVTPVYAVLKYESVFKKNYLGKFALLQNKNCNYGIAS